LPLVSLSADAPEVAVIDGSVECPSVASLAPAGLATDFGRRRIDEIRPVYRVGTIERGAVGPSAVGSSDG
jgi:hypothetical protein